jgi:hypothetical protein
MAGFVFTTLVVGRFDLRLHFSHTPGVLRHAPLNWLATKDPMS